MNSNNKYKIINYGIIILAVCAYIFFFIFVCKGIKADIKNIDRYVLLISFFPALFICMIIHELGHYIAARANCLDTSGIRFNKKEFGLCVYVSNLNKKNISARRNFLYSGILMNIKAAMIFLPTLLIKNEVMKTILFTVVVLNLMMAIVNIIPIKNSDGWQIMFLYKKNYKYFLCIVEVIFIELMIIGIILIAAFK